MSRNQKNCSRKICNRMGSESWQNNISQYGDADCYALSVCTQKTRKRYVVRS